MNVFELTATIRVADVTELTGFERFTFFRSAHILRLEFREGASLPANGIFIPLTMGKFADGAPAWFPTDFDHKLTGGVGWKIDTIRAAMRTDNT